LTRDASVHETSFVGAQMNIATQGVRDMEVMKNR